MKDLKKQMKLLLWGTLLLFIIIAAACGNASQQGDGNTVQPPPVSQGGEQTPNVTPDQPKPVTLTFFESSSGRSEEWFMEPYGNAIQTKFPHVTVKFRFSQKVNDENIGLPQIIASDDNDIDIIMSSVGSFIPTIIDNALEFDHSELIKKYNYDLNRLDSTPVELMGQLSNGGLWGLPVTASANAIVYNREIFDKFGVDYPQDNMTWDELYDLARVLTRTEDDIRYRGFVASHSHVALVNQLSASYVDPVTNRSLISSDPRWAVHSQNMFRFHQIPGNEVDSTSVGAAHAQFTTEKIAAMYVNSLDATFLNPETFGIDMDAVQMPHYADLPGVGSQLYPTYFSITNSSVNKDASFEVIAWLTSDEFQLQRARRGITPVLNSVEIREAIGQEVDYLQGRNAQAFLPINPASPSILTPFNTVANTQFLLEIRKYITGQIDLNTMLRQADEAINSKIDEALANN